MLSEAFFVENEVRLFVEFCQHGVLVWMLKWFEQIYLRRTIATYTALGEAHDKTFFYHIFVLIALAKVEKYYPSS